MGHNLSFDDSETLAKEFDEFRLLLRESLLILHDGHPLKRYVKSILLELFYDYLQFSFIISASFDN